jgi:hypothetical protein
VKKYFLTYFFPFLIGKMLVISLLLFLFSLSMPSIPRNNSAQFPGDLVDIWYYLCWFSLLLIPFIDWPVLTFIYWKQNKNTNHGWSVLYGALVCPVVLLATIIMAVVSLACLQWSLLPFSS